MLLFDRLHGDEPMQRADELCSSTGKIGWLTKLDAERALAEIRDSGKRRRGGKTEIALYPCVRCGHWHLTSEEQNP